jgi:hypothetical protein
MLPFDLSKVSDRYINSYANDFLIANLDHIKKYYEYGCKNKSISFLAMKDLILSQLKTSCYSFANNNNDPNTIDPYLFSSIHRFINQFSSNDIKKSYICPACKYFSRIEVLDLIDKKLICNYCSNISSTDEWEKFLRTSFSQHSKKGYACGNCSSFIPDNNSSIIICPFPDCSFIGQKNNLKLTKHPKAKVNLEIENNEDICSNVVINTSTYDINKYIDIINKCIDHQLELIEYKSNNSTVISKLSMYEAFKILIERYPYDMISYLIYFNRNGRIQCRLFQEFVSILENKIPFSFSKSSQTIYINSILDPNLFLFEGSSEFSSIVKNREIDNATKELYYGKKCFIGKLVNIYHDGKSILNEVEEYSFAKIFLKSNKYDGKNVLVKHYRIPPHYQTGGLAVLNKIRRNIVDRVYYEINGKKREIKC